MREILESHLLKNTLSSRVNIFPETLETFLSTEKYIFITPILVFQFIPSIKEKEYFLSKISEFLQPQGKAVMFEMTKFNTLDAWFLNAWGGRLCDLGVSKEMVNQMKKNLQENFAPISEQELRQISSDVRLKMSGSFYPVLNFKAYYFEKV